VGPKVNLLQPVLAGIAALRKLVAGFVEPRGEGREPERFGCRLLYSPSLAQPGELKAVTCHILVFGPTGISDSARKAVFICFYSFLCNFYFLFPHSTCLPPFSFGGFVAYRRSDGSWVHALRICSFCLLEPGGKRDKSQAPPLRKHRGACLGLSRVTKGVLAQGRGG